MISPVYKINFCYYSPNAVAASKNIHFTTLPLFFIWRIKLTHTVTAFQKAVHGFSFHSIVGLDRFSFFYSHNLNIIKPSFLPQWTKLYSTHYKKCIVHTKIKSYISKEIRLVDLLHTAVIFISYLIHIQASSSEQAFLKQFFKAINDSFPSIDGETERKPWQGFIQTGNSGGCRNYSFNPCPEQHNIRTLLTSLRLGFPNNMISITKGILKLNSDSGFIFLIFFLVVVVS